MPNPKIRKLRAEYETAHAVYLDRVRTVVTTLQNVKVPTDEMLTAESEALAALIAARGALLAEVKKLRAGRTPRSSD
jgi:hypothetical protein